MSMFDYNPASDGWSQRSSSDIGGWSQLKRDMEHFCTNYHELFAKRPGTIRYFDESRARIACRLKALNKEQLEQVKTWQNYSFFVNENQS